MFERFTDRARRVLVLAQEEARLLDHGFIGTEHLLLGLIGESDGIAAAVLTDLGITLAGVRRRVEEVIGRSAIRPTGSPPFTPRAKKVLDLSLREAMQLGHSTIGTEHILLGIVQEGDGVASQVLVSLGADPTRVRHQVVQALSGDRSGEPQPAGADPTPPEGTGDSIAIACSFCGKVPPESGQIVSGANAHICEHCIRRWAGRLGEET